MGVYEPLPLLFFYLFPPIFLSLTVHPTLHFLILQPSYCNFVIFTPFPFVTSTQYYSNLEWTQLSTTTFLFSSYLDDSSTPTLNKGKSLLFSFYTYNIAIRQSFAWGPLLPSLCMFFIVNLIYFCSFKTHLKISNNSQLFASTYLSLLHSRLMYPVDTMWLSWILQSQCVQNHILLSSPRSVPLPVYGITISGMAPPSSFWLLKSPDFQIWIMFLSFSPHSFIYLSYWLYPLNNSQNVYFKLSSFPAWIIATVPCLVSLNSAFFPLAHFSHCLRDLSETQIWSVTSLIKIP